MRICVIRPFCLDVSLVTEWKDRDCSVLFKYCVKTWDKGSHFLGEEWVKMQGQEVKMFLAARRARSGVRLTGSLIINEYLSTVVTN